MSERFDKIPIWDGKPETFDEHFVEVDLYCRQFPTWKEGIAIAKILGQLQGQSRLLMQSLSEAERSKVTTKLAYRTFLRGHLLETGIPELGRSFRSWLKLRRQPKEGMRLFLARHRQLLAKMESTLNEGHTQKTIAAKLKKLIDEQKLELLMQEKKETIRDQINKNKWERSKDTIHGKCATRTIKKFVREDGNWVKKDVEVPIEDDDWEQISQKSHRSEAKSSKSWEWSSSHDGWSQWQGWKEEEEEPVTIKDRMTELATKLAELEVACPDQSAKIAQLTECISHRWRETILPDSLLGYHVLSGSGLSATERATVLTVTATYSQHDLTTPLQEGSTGLSLNTVEKALLSTWQDREIIERDSVSHKPQGRKRNGKAYAMEGESDFSDSEASNGEANVVEDSEASEQEDALLLDNLEGDEQQAFAVHLTRKYTNKDRFKKAKLSFKESKTFVRNLKKARLPRYNNQAGKVNEINFAKIKSGKVPFKTSFGKGQASKDRTCFKCGSSEHLIKQCTAMLEDVDMIDDIICVVSEFAASSKARNTVGPAFPPSQASMAEEEEDEEYSSAEESEEESENDRSAPPQVKKAPVVSPASQVPAKTETGQKVAKQSPKPVPKESHRSVPASSSKDTEKKDHRSSDKGRTRQSDRDRDRGRDRDRDRERERESRDRRSDRDRDRSRRERSRSHAKGRSKDSIKATEEDDTKVIDSSEDLEKILEEVRRENREKEKKIKALEELRIEQRRNEELRKKEQLLKQLEKERSRSLKLDEDLSQALFDYNAELPAAKKPKVAETEVTDQAATGSQDVPPWTFFQERYN